MTATPRLGEEGLRNAAAKSNLLYGTAICTSDLSSKVRSRAIVRDCSLITPEFEMKWNVVGVGPSLSNYRAMDELVAFAGNHGIAIHGHTLWWHEAIPHFLRDSSKQVFTEEAFSFLEQSVARYVGRMHSWDVINEPLCHDQPGELRGSRFMEVLGAGYIGTAFHRVHAIDPAAMLVLNEMGLEYASDKAELKRRAMLSLLERELGKGTPIHCLGIQSHLDAADQPREHPEFRSFLREVRNLGLKIMITEMDVSDAQCTGGPRERDKAVSETYRAYIELLLEESRAVSVSTWGLSDDRSWLNAAPSRGDGPPLRPLLLNRSLQRKPAWHAMRAALLRCR